MAFNNWPYTNFQDLNLGWILGKLGVVERLAIDSAASVSQYDARITANTNAIEQLGIDLDSISDVAKVFVNSDLEAYYRGNHITGSELFSVFQSHGTLPFVEYNGEVYMLDSVSNAGDMRFSMGHTVDTFNELVIRHIMIPAQSYNAAYSITNVSAGGGSSGNVFAVVVREQSGSYVADHTYSEIISQMQNGRIPVLLVSFGSNPVSYQICGMGRNATRTVSGQTIQEICFADPSWMTDSGNNNVGEWFIDANNYVGHIASLKQMATLDNIIQFVNDGVTTNALLKTAQTLSAAEQAQVKQNLGITSGESSGMTQIPITVSGGVYSTNMTAAELFNHMHTNGCFAVVNGVYYVPVGGDFSGPFGDIYFQSVAQSDIEKTDVEVLKFYMHGDAAIVITAYSRDIPLLTAPPIVDTATGDPASITDGANHYPLKSLIANIDPVQSGSGDPSPSNVRPITGWTTIRITKAITGDSGYWDITLPSAAGIVYGGTLDVTTGVLTVDTVSKTISWGRASAITQLTNTTRFLLLDALVPGWHGRSVICDRLTKNDYGTDAVGFSHGDDSANIFIKLDKSLGLTNSEQINEWLSNNPLQFVYKLATPITYQLDPLTLYTALGHNGFSADSGAVTVEYYADTKLYIQKLVATNSNNRTSVTEVKEKPEIVLKETESEEKSEETPDEEITEETEP